MVRFRYSEASQNRLRYPDTASGLCRLGKKILPEPILNIFTGIEDQEFTDHLKQIL
jgi:hypothetical protein